MQSVCRHKTGSEKWAKYKNPFIQKKNPNSVIWSVPRNPVDLTEKRIKNQEREKMNPFNAATG